MEVERFNLSQEPAAFIANQTVVAAMHGHDDTLRLLLLDRKNMLQGRYPGREALAALVGLAVPRSLYTEEVAELVAIGTAQLPAPRGPRETHGKTPSPRRLRYLYDHDRRNGSAARPRRELLLRCVEPG